MHARPRKDMIWANLLHLSVNLWFDCPPSVFKGHKSRAIAQPYLRFDDSLWSDILSRMAAAGMNMVVLDLGDGVRYRSHPEIAVRNAWSPRRLKEEVRRARAMGIEIIPKLNFSTAHDVWLGPYARMVSTPAYYRVCRDLIAEVNDLCEGPRFFHLGMDEETAVNQVYNRLVVIRQFDLFWDDLTFYVDEVRKGGARPWVWSDYQWYHPAQFVKHMPTSVLQSNWWYYKTLHPETILKRANPQVMDAGANPAQPLRLKPVKAYLEMERHGYDQVPTGGYLSFPNNFARTVAFARTHIAPRRLLGFLQTTWRSTQEEFRAIHMQAIDRVAAEIRKAGRARTDARAARPARPPAGDMSRGAVVTIPSHPRTRKETS